MSEQGLYIYNTNIYYHKHIGSGYFGRVYEGYMPAVGKVAVKKFRSEWVKHPYTWEYIKRIVLEEARMLAQAKHDYVVDVYDILISPDNDEICIVMEYCEGGSVQSLCTISPLSLKRSRKILMDVALGLDALHNRSLIHRDIKPGNILLDRIGRAKISDFGLTIIKHEDGYGPQGGYHTHLAPEVLTKKRTSATTDIWAFGITAARLLIGEQLYNDAIELLYTSTNEDEYLKPEQVRDSLIARMQQLPHISKEWIKLIKKACHSNPAQRIQTALLLQKELSALPILPEWDIVVNKADGLIEWVNQQGKRIRKVTWRSLESNYTWDAISYSIETPIRKKKLAGSSALQNFQDSFVELASYLQKL